MLTIVLYCPLGGLDEMSQLPLAGHRRAMVGCVSDLSLGQMYNIDLLRGADKGANVEDCRNTF